MSHPRPPVWVLRPLARHHPADDVVSEFVAAMVRAGATLRRAWRVQGRAHAFKVPARPRAGRRSPVIVPMMGADFSLLHQASWMGTPVPYAWDVWEGSWPLWVQTIRRLRLPLVLVTASQSAEYLSGALPTTRIVCVPEATDVAKFPHPCSLGERTTDVLELGRRYAAWHDAVAPGLARLGTTHLYERAPGDLIFKGRGDLIRGLASARISVCFPSSITHPDRAGSVTTMTNRYLESLISGCLVLGRGVPELTNLMGYDPVIRADLSEPTEQLVEILDQLPSYQGHVDQARDAVRKVGDWSSRAVSIMEQLRESELYSPL